MAKKPKLCHLPPAGCQISSRSWTRGSAACRRPSPRGLSCILDPMAIWLAISSWRCSIFKDFTPRSSPSTRCIVDLLTHWLRWPRVMVDMLTHRLRWPRFCRVSSLLFPRVLRNWGKRTLRFLPQPGRSRGIPIAWNFFTIFHTVKRFISSVVLQLQHYFFHFCEA